MVITISGATEGNDQVTVVAGTDYFVNLLAGDDTLGVVQAGNTATILGGLGADSIDTFSGLQLIYGNHGHDTIHSEGSNCTVFGGQDNDSVSVGRGHHAIYGNMGDDTILAASGGSDSVYGGQGNDDIRLEGTGWAFASGNLGNDTIVIAPASPGFSLGGGILVYGNEGDDLIELIGDSDDYDNREGTIYAGQGGDSVEAEEGVGGRLIIYGNKGADLLVGGSDSDVIYGGQDGDTIRDGVGHDALFGNLGDDRLEGDTTSRYVDTQTGGEGADTFVFNYSGHTVFGVAGASDLVIADLSTVDTLVFDDANDVLGPTELSGFAAVTDDGTDVTIRFEAGTATIVLKGIGNGMMDSLADLTAAYSVDFV